MAYILCTETDTRPSVGNSASQPSPVLESQAAAGHCDLIAHAVIAGQRRSFLYHPSTQKFLPDSDTEPELTSTQLADIASSLLFLGVPTGEGSIRSIDRDGDGTRNRDTPPPVLSIDSILQPVASPERPDWFIEASEDLKIWAPATAEPSELRTRFFRLHRTW